ncbi:spore germination protein GerPE [Neobacillus sp. D3-1R]|uniref:spore germination protein GerPE n=1 Tax=Neobacillus sp. D3-1R TaxID=3445778 RepID=UPI003FA104A8
MLSRSSQVQTVKITSVAIGSVTQIGDSCIINALSRALAVQRESEIFLGNEGDYSKYPIFSELIPLPPIEDHVVMQRMNLSPIIRVGHINVIGVSSASGIHIGSSEHICLEARVKHIRHLESVDEEEASQLPVSTD